MTTQTSRLPLTALRRKKPNSQAWIGYLFILPAIVGFVVFYLYPALRGLQISFTDWNLLSDPKSVGLANYDEAIHDPKFWSALWITVKYVLWNIPLQTLLSILLAVAMDRLVKGMFVKGLIILPYLLSSVLVAMIFLWMLDPLLGIVNQWLDATPIGKQAFFTSTDQAIPTIALINIWKHMGFNALLFYAGIQAIPRTVYEAASIDGATRVDRVLENHAAAAAPGVGVRAGDFADRLVPDLRHGGRDHPGRPGGLHQGAGLLHLPKRLRLLPNGLRHRHEHAAVRLAGGLHPAATALFAGQRI